MKWWQSGALIFAFVLFPSASIAGACMLYFVFMRHVKKWFDVYYFRQGKKRVIIYQCKKFTVYYRNRKELVCIENKSGRWVPDYTYEDFMNLKLGFGSLVGDLHFKELRNGGFAIWTPARYNTSTGLYNRNGYALLSTDKEGKPVKLFINGSPSIIYEFKYEENFKVIIPKQVAYAFGSIH